MGGLVENAAVWILARRGILRIDGRDGRLNGAERNRKHRLEAIDGDHRQNMYSADVN